MDYSALTPFPHPARKSFPAYLCPAGFQLPRLSVRVRTRVLLFVIAFAHIQLCENYTHDAIAMSSGGVCGPLADPPRKTLSAETSSAATKEAGGGGHRTSP